MWGAGAGGQQVNVTDLKGFVFLRASKPNKACTERKGLLKEVAPSLETRVS